MPTVASLEALERAAPGFEIGDTRLVIEPPALTEVRRSLESAGLLLLGEAPRARPAGPDRGDRPAAALGAQGFSPG
jgi:hypothetical protein